jgi:cytoskeletal protein RodZ
VTDHEPDSDDARLTRRERRLALERARRGQAVVGWFGYAVGVVFVIATAAALAVGAGITTAPRQEPRTTKATTPAVALPRTATTTSPASSAEVVQVVDAAAPTTTTTSTTTGPVVAAAETPGAPPVTP